jgi:NhaP-type Na+/H+ or K+/H+ antiporter
LALFVAPTLLDAAYDASPRDLRNYLGPVVSLAVVMVVLTVASVAWTVHRLVPDMSWAAAVALGAIVAPPDASAATAVLRKLQPPPLPKTMWWSCSRPSRRSATVNLRLSRRCMFGGL